MFSFFLMIYLLGFSLDCCQRKNVGEFNYTLHSTGEDMNNVPDDCKNTCVYTRDNEKANGQVYCFADGDQIPKCLGVASNKEMVRISGERRFSCEYPAVRQSLTQ